MNSRDKEYLRRALKSQRPHEKFNAALAREVSDELENKEGYRTYIDLINKVRRRAKENESTQEDAAKSLIKGE